jgi:6-pyruvoyltetrahydropterin/6-carboxytetrahydropterin synthase
VVELRLRIFRRYEFASAHYLPGHPKCGNMHGHNYVLEVGLETKGGEPLYLDFADVDLRMRPIINKLDHRVLNDLIKYPSVENICEYLYNEIYLVRLPVRVIRLWEDSRSYCVLEVDKE